MVRVYSLGIPCFPYMCMSDLSALLFILFHAQFGCPVCACSHTTSLVCYDWEADREEFSTHVSVHQHFPLDAGFVQHAMMT